MIVSTDDMYEPYEAFLDLITRRVTINLYMFSAFMKYRISRNVNGRLVVTKELSCVLNCNLQISKQLLQPDEFTSRQSHAAIFCFSTASTHCLLLLTLPTDQ